MPRLLPEELWSSRREGSSGQISFFSVDRSGNVEPQESQTVNIDETPPTLNPTVSPNPVLLNGTATVSANATGGLSGVASQSCGAVSTSSVGSQTVSCTAADRAGNTVNGQAAYQVQYAPVGTTCDGSPSHAVLPPVAAGSSTFKKGSTVPIKFRVCDAQGASIGSAGVVGAFQMIRAVQNGNVTVNEPVVSTTPDTAFRWDATNQQWIFNLTTKNLSAGTTDTYEIALNDSTTIDFTFLVK